MKKVFIYVGHSNWGKSRALKVLTNNDSYQRIGQIGQFNICVRKMSNSEYSQGLLEWVKDFPKMKHQRFVITFCPVFQPKNGNEMWEQMIAWNILYELQKTNQLYFFVQEEKYNFPEERITQEEINWLKNFGMVRILQGQKPDTARASEFLNFMLVNFL